MRRGSPKLSLRETFATNVRMVRIASGLSQEALAAECELDRTFIGSVERSERNISIDNMERIAHALKTDIGELVATELAQRRGYDVAVVRKPRQTRR